MSLTFKYFYCLIYIILDIRSWVITAQVLDIVGCPFLCGSSRSSSEIHWLSRSSGSSHSIQQILFYILHLVQQIGSTLLCNQNGTTYDFIKVIHKVTVVLQLKS